MTELHSEYKLYSQHYYCYHRESKTYILVCDKLTCTEESAHGVDVISACTFIICKLLNHLVNPSLTTGKFLNNFKTVKTILIYKTNDITEKNNFLPNSLLSLCFKIPKKNAKEQVSQFLYSNGILCKNQ